jgi:HAE1 family hydrophobic/amphiphilic exporter-1
VVGSIPVAIGIGEGSEFRRGLSIVLIGGLITSMLLTLLVVPTAYSLLESVTRRLGGLFRRRPAPEEDIAEPLPVVPVPAAHGGALAGDGTTNGHEEPALEPQERA